MTMGGVKDAALSDYLKVLEPPDPHEHEQTYDVAELQQAFGFNPLPRKDARDEQ